MSECHAVGGFSSPGGTSTHNAGFQYTISTVNNSTKMINFNTDNYIKLVL